MICWSLECVPQETAFNSIDMLLTTRQLLTTSNALHTNKQGTGETRQLLSEKGLTSHSTHNRSFQRWNFNQFHLCW